MNSIMNEIKALIANKAIRLPLLVLMAIPILLVIVFKIKLWKPKYRRTRTRVITRYRGFRRRYRRR